VACQGAGNSAMLYMMAKREGADQDMCAHHSRKLPRSGKSRLVIRMGYWRERALGIEIELEAARGCGAALAKQVDQGHAGDEAADVREPRDATCGRAVQ